MGVRSRTIYPFRAGPGPKAGGYGVIISTRRLTRDTAAGPRYLDYHYFHEYILYIYKFSFFFQNASGALLPTVAVTRPGVFTANSRRRSKQHLVTWY